MHPALAAALTWTALAIPAALAIGRALRNADQAHAHTRTTCPTTCPCGNHAKQAA